jgi:hypothetical protein
LLPASLEIERPRLQSGCNLFRGTRFGSFEQHLRHQTRDDVGLRVSARRPLRKTAPIATSGSRDLRDQKAQPFDSSNF